jgi:integrase
VAKHTYRWWDGDVYRQATFTTKADKADFVTEVRRRRRLGLSLSFEPEEPDPRLDEFIEDYWRLHAIPNLGHATRRTYEQEWVKWILPRLGSYRLRQLSARIIVRELVDPMRRASAGEHTVRTTLAVLQSILSFALAEERVPENVVRKVRKPSSEVTREVPAITPAQVEQLRALLAGGFKVDLGKRRVRRPPDPVSATIVSLLAYEGLRPEELLALDVERHVGPGGVSVRSKVVSHRKPDGHWVAEVLPYTKTRRNRVVPWTAPQVRRDVRDHVMVSGVRRGLLFPKAGDPQQPWIKHDWDNWREDVYQPAARAVGITDPRPYDLRSAFVSLLAWEGYTMLEVARRAGHSVQTCEKHYAKVFEDVTPDERVTAEQAIAAAREPGVAGVGRLFDVGATS